MSEACALGDTTHVCIGARVANRTVLEETLHNTTKAYAANW